MIYQSFPGPVALLTIILVAASFLYMAIHVMHVNAALRGAAEEGPRFHAFLIAAGLIGILLGRIPSWIAGLPLRFQTAYDRYTIAMQIGAILALYGMIDLVSSKARIKNLAFSLIIALAIGTQFQAGNDFRRDWQKQADIFWQMAWRMPSLESNTLLLTDQMPSEYEPDLSYTAPLNWMYAPSYPMPDTTSDLPYALIYTEKRLGGPTLPALEPGTDVSFAFRTVNFNGNTSEAVVIFMPRNGCLRVLDPLLGDMQTYGKESKYLVEAIPLSDPSRINLYPPSAARPMFFREPAYEWCYYYAKAELARQREDWSAVVSLGDKAAALGYSTNDPLEYLPFIEASARLGNWSRAETLAQRALNLSGESRVQKSVCLVWERILAGTPATSENQIPILHLLTEYHCTK